jgi:NAD(P)-dependent dehydrogenase (short-subunit alcohol dehydrogenase family)
MNFLKSQVPLFGPPGCVWSKMQRNAIVTGGSRGIGKAIATTLAQQGYRVAVLARNLEGAASVASSLPVTAETSCCQNLLHKLILER